nr:hypothetical protein GCM10020093_082090 [Planobispora longispora]
MSTDLASTVASGSLALALPIAVAAGLVSFLSPCVLPLVPGYLSYVTGMSADPRRGRMVAGIALFVLGFAAVFVAAGRSPAASARRCSATPRSSPGCSAGSPSCSASPSWA